MNKSLDNNSSDSHSQQHLANKRTFLAWLRTCVALIGLGFVVSRFGLLLSPFFLSEAPSSISGRPLIRLLPLKALHISLRS